MVKSSFLQQLSTVLLLVSMPMLAFPFHGNYVPGVVENVGCEARILLHTRTRMESGGLQKIQQSSKTNLNNQIVDEAEDNSISGGSKLKPEDNKSKYLKDLQSHEVSDPDSFIKSFEQILKDSKNNNNFSKQFSKFCKRLGHFMLAPGFHFLIILDESNIEIEGQQEKLNCNVSFQIFNANKYLGKTNGLQFQQAFMIKICQLLVKHDVLVGLRVFSDKQFNTTYSEFIHHLGKAIFLVGFCPDKGQTLNIVKAFGNQKKLPKLTTLVYFGISYVSLESMQQHIIQLQDLTKLAPKLKNLGFVIQVENEGHGKAVKRLLWPLIKMVKLNGCINTAVILQDYKLEKLLCRFRVSVSESDQDKIKNLKVLMKTKLADSEVKPFFLFGKIVKD